MAKRRKIDRNFAAAANPMRKTVTTVLVSGGIALALMGLGYMGIQALRSQSVSDQSQQQGPSESKDDGQQDPATIPSKEQKELNDEMSAEADALQTLLRAYVWESSDGRTTIEFDEDTYEVKSNGETVLETTYAIGNTDVDDTGAYSAVLVDHDDRASVLTMASEPADATAPRTLMFTRYQDGLGVYNLAHRSQDLTPEMPDDELMALLPCKSKDIAEAFRSIENDYPTARTAALDPAVYLDYESGTAELLYVLDNTAEASIKVIVDMKTGAVTTERM